MRRFLVWVAFAVIANTCEAEIAVIVRPVFMGTLPLRPRKRKLTPNSPLMQPTLSKRVHSRYVVNDGCFHLRRLSPDSSSASRKKPIRLAGRSSCKTELSATSRRTCRKCDFTGGSTDQAALSGSTISGRIVLLRQLFQAGLQPQAALLGRFKQLQRPSQHNYLDLKRKNIRYISVCRNASSGTFHDDFIFAAPFTDDDTDILALSWTDGTVLGFRWEGDQ